MTDAQLKQCEFARDNPAGRAVDYFGSPSPMPEAAREHGLALAEEVARLTARLVARDREFDHYRAVEQFRRTGDLGHPLTRGFHTLHEPDVAPEAGTLAEIDAGEGLA